MKTSTRILSLWLAAVALLLSGCVTGERAYQLGDYTRAVHLSAKRLAGHPNSRKAEDVLVNAYPQARAEWLQRADYAKSETFDPFRWERVYEAYRHVHDLADRARQTPVGQAAALDLSYFDSAQQEARTNAAAARDRAGDALLAHGERHAARDAYFHFERSLSYLPHQSDVGRKLALAKALGTLRVSLGPVVSRDHGLGLNPAELERAVLEELASRPIHQFVEFVPGYLAEVADTHHYLQLTVVGADIGREYESHSSYDYAREIVVGKTEEAEPKEIKKTVFAQLFEHRKETRSDAWLSMNIYDEETDTLAFTRQIREQVDWRARWYRVFGDRRALSKPVHESHEPIAPSYYSQAQELTEELAETVYYQLRSYYRGR